MSCEQLSDQLLELLYGELPAGERSAVDAHLAGCERCRAELEAFRQTRALVRGTLEEPAPARAHAAILRAAAEHAGAGAKRQENRDEKRAETRAETRAERPRAAEPSWSFWDWIRTRWAFPTLATVGAVAVFLLSSRIFFEPQKTLERGHAGLLPAEAPAPEPGAAPASSAGESAAKPAATAAAAPPAVADRERSSENIPEVDKPAQATGGLSGLSKNAAAHAKVGKRKAPVAMAEGKGAGAASSSSASSAFAAPEDSPVDNNEARRDEDGFGARKREFAPPPPPRAEAPGRAGGGAGLDDLLTSRSRPAAKASPAAAKAKKRDERVGDERSADEEAEMDEAPSAARAPAPAAPAGGRLAPSTPAPAPAPAKPAPAKEEAASESDEPVTSRRAAPASAAPYGAAGAPARDKETLVQRADRLFSEHRWVEAAVAYRDLLRQDPRSSDASRWRQRLAAAEAEQAATSSPARR